MQLGWDRTLARGFAAARAICSRHARSFYFASFFLPRPKRDYAYAVYAFCRLIDDAIDMPAAIPQPSRTSLPVCCTSEVDQRFTLLQTRLDEIYASTHRPPPNEDEPSLALHAFSHTVRTCAIPRQYFLDLVEGCRMDLTIARYRTWADLEKYCYHVAGVVGLIMCRVFDLREERALRQAVAMGNAMQLTNILRDVKEDWDRGRIYLPGEDLARFGYTETDLAANTVNSAFRELMKFQISRARQLYNDGAEGLCHLANDGSRLTAAAMASIYGGILDAIERQQYDVFSSRAHLKTWQKFLCLPTAYRLSKREFGDAPAVAFRR